MKIPPFRFVALLGLLFSFYVFPTTSVSQAEDLVGVRGSIIDSENGQLLPARLYIQSESGEFYHATSVGGAAIPYDKRRDTSVEVHTSLSAHPFEIKLTPGEYTLTVERGKEYLPEVQEISVGAEPINIKIPLKRWIDMSAENWFSGETHVHRTMEELPTLLLCEDLNVALPLTAWVRNMGDTPRKNNMNKEPVPEPALISVDDTHVIWPINTEYEIGRVKGPNHPLGTRHVMGALFVLNHKKPLDLPAPPVIPVAEEAGSQGALLDLDKHNWPWSLMLIPTTGVHLFELTNNHLWRADFRFTTWFPEYVPDYMGIELNDGGFDERGWIDFGLRTYYALLNCGFEMKPSAGTASGVHPVPLGFGRVYVRVPEPFSYERWIEGLSEGRSFVTTGPMLQVTFNDRDPGEVFAATEDGSFSVQIRGTASSVHPIREIEVVTRGEVIRLQAENAPLAGGGYEARIETTVAVSDSSWVAVRVFENREDGRERFAHTAPVWIRKGDEPVRPRREEVEYLLKRVTDEIVRGENVLPADVLDEYRKARQAYQMLLDQAL